MVLQLGFVFGWQLVPDGLAYCFRLLVHWRCLSLVGPLRLLSGPIYPARAAKVRWGHASQWTGLAAVGGWDSANWPKSHIETRGGRDLQSCNNQRYVSERAPGNHRMDGRGAPHIVRLSFALLDHSAHFVVRIGRETQADLWYEVPEHDEETPAVELIDSDPIRRNGHSAFPKVSAAAASGAV